MAETTLLKMVEENPKTAAAAASGVIGAYNYIIFDPYRHCSMFMTITSAAVTYALIIGTSMISWEAWSMGIQEAFKLLTSAAGLTGTLITTYSVWKKLKTTRRRRRLKKSQ